MKEYRNSKIEFLIPISVVILIILGAIISATITFAYVIAKPSSNSLYVDTVTENLTKLKYSNGVYIMQNDYLKLKILDKGNNTLMKILDRKAFTINENTEVTVQFNMKWSIDYKPNDVWVDENIKSSNFYSTVTNDTGCFIYQNCTTDKSNSIIIIVYKMLNSENRIKYDITLIPKVTANYRITYKMKNNLTNLIGYFDVNNTQSGQIFKFKNQAIKFDYSDVPSKYKTSYQYDNVTGNYVFKANFGKLNVNQKVELDPATIFIGSSGGSEVVSDTINFSMTTNMNNSLIILDIVGYGGGYNPFIHTLTNDKSLTFTNRANHTYSTGYWYHKAWRYYAVWSGHGNINFEIVFDQPIDHGVAICYAILNANNTYPFDVNTVKAQGSTQYPTSTITTVNNRDMIIVSCEGYYGIDLTSLDFINIRKVAKMSSDFNITNTFGSYTVNYEMAGSTDWIMMMDAVKEAVGNGGTTTITTTTTVTTTSTVTSTTTIANATVTSTISTGGVLDINFFEIMLLMMSIFLPMIAFAMRSKMIAFLGLLISFVYFAYFITAHNDFPFFVYFFVFAILCINLYAVYKKVK